MDCIRGVMEGIDSMDCSTGFCSCGTVHPATDTKDGRWSRRGLLRSGLTVGAFAAGFGKTLVMPSLARAQTAMTPEKALKEMMDGNKRFIQQDLTSFNEDLDILKKKAAEGQSPFAALLSCADSRVPVELVFDQSIGRLFVTRVAGNIATADMMASLEYGVAVLGAKAIMVLGHSSCGAVKATIDGKAVPGQISALYRSIRPAVDQAGKNLEAAIKANAKIQAGLLRTSSPVFAEMLAKGELKIAAAHYDIESGVVSILD